MFHKLYVKALALSHGVEHLGFVAYAAAETFALHHILWWISVWLLAAGVAACVAEKLGE